MATKVHLSSGSRRFAACDRWTQTSVAGNAARQRLPAAELGGYHGGNCPQNFTWSPSGPPKFFRSLSKSPTQTINSSPCCKTGPSSGPPKWKCLAPPLATANSNKSRCEKKHTMWKLKRNIAANEFYTVWKETLLLRKRNFGTVAVTWVIFFVL